MPVSLVQKPEPTAVRTSLGDSRTQHDVAVGREEQLLLYCARTHIDADTAARIRSLADQEIDWLYLRRIAGQHGVVPLLYQSLHTTCPEAVPEALLAELRGRFHANIVRNYAFAGQLTRILDLFEAHHIPALPLKGPALAASVYGHLSLRQFGDLDILVQERDLAAAGDLLVSQGYAPECSRTRAQERGALQVLHHVTFVGHDNQATVELHGKLASWTRVLSFPLDRLWQQTVQVPLLKEKTVRSFAPGDLLLYLCVHGTGHRWESLNWVCDVAELIRVHPELNWEHTLEQARQMGSERRLHLGLSLAEDLLGTRLPGHVRQRVKADPPVGLLARQVRRALFCERPRGRFEQHLFEQRVTGHWRKQVRLLWRILVFRLGIRWALKPPDGPLAFLYRLLERVPSPNVWLWPLPFYALLFLASHAHYPIRRALGRAFPPQGVRIEGRPSQTRACAPDSPDPEGQGSR